MKNIQFSFKPDSTHVDNPDIWIEKENVIGQHVKLGKWYSSTNQGLFYINGNWYRNGVEGKLTPDKVIGYLRSEITPKINESDLLTSDYRQSLLVKSERLRKPYNLAGLMTNDSFSNNILEVSTNENFIYEEYLIYTHSIYPDAGDHDEYEPEVSDEKVKQCLLEMITVNGNQATLALWLYLIDGLRESKPYYLTFYFDKVEGEWLLDDLQIHKDVK